jgi:hypothetical protein
MFPFVPPRRYSYPDYRLAAGETVKVGECFDSDTLGVVIDQARYRLITRRHDGSLVVEWPDEVGSRYSVSLPDAQGFRTMQRMEPVHEPA